MSTQEEKLKAIADAIRYVENSSGSIPASDFPAVIRALKGVGGTGYIELLRGYTIEIVRYVGHIRLADYESVVESSAGCQVLEGYV